MRLPPTLVIAALVVAACVSRGTYSEMAHLIPPVPEGAARIYFYRPSSMESGHQPTIVVDRVGIGKAVSNGFRFVDVSPGVHDVATSSKVEHNRSYTLAEGEVVYIRLRTAIAVFAGHVIPEQMPPDEAHEELARMNYVGPSTLLE
jgi:hypothetical protein